MPKPSCNGESNICMTVAEVAQRLGITPAMVLEAVQEGRARIRVTIDPKPLTVDAIARRH